MKLLPYDKDRLCPKCEHKGASTQYLPLPNFPYWASCEGTASRDHVEHLHRHCPNCHFEWCEAPVVSPVNSEGLTPEQVAPTLKNAADVAGIWDLTGGVDPVEHIRRMRGDD